MPNGRLVWFTAGFLFFVWGVGLGVVVFRSAFARRLSCRALARRLYRPFSWSMRQVSRGHTPVIGGFVRCLRGFRRLLWSREIFVLAPVTRQVLDVAHYRVGVYVVTKSE
jgi:hypothetical protein